MQDSSINQLHRYVELVLQSVVEWNGFVQSCQKKVLSSHQLSLIGGCQKFLSIEYMNYDEEGEGHDDQ